ncbi:MAG: cation:proton antiporter [Nocardioides sp.]|nr:cation:proton antiporter [Nocardioides sp.]
MNDPLSLVGGVLLVLGALAFLLTAIGMLRSRDAISRINNLSPATGFGLPLIIIGSLLHEGAQGRLSVMGVVAAVVAIFAALVVSSVGSNLLARAAYRSQDELDPRTVGNAMSPYEQLPDPGVEPDHDHRSRRRRTSTDEPRADG